MSQIVGTILIALLSAIALIMALTASIPADRYGAVGPVQAIRDSPRSRHLLLAAVAVVLVLLALVFTAAPGWSVRG